MAILALALSASVAALHLWFLILEMFLWTKPIGLKTFHMNAEKAKTTRVLAANQGLYNGFLAAGITWSFIARDAVPIRIFFLSCVAIAGTFGAATVGKKIFFIQALPAALAIALILLAS